MAAYSRPGPPMADPNNRELPPPSMLTMLRPLSLPLSEPESVVIEASLRRRHTPKPGPTWTSPPSSARSAVDDRIRQFAVVPNGAARVQRHLAETR
ncbi:hypothetical protein VTJ04DRAFT_5952 [Mycothermus thermophilus]|uniref:uncharacterized protein n=1 Tax=Humicola insolens TaxID=85995 RepID=UPI0037441175